MKPRAGLGAMVLVAALAPVAAVTCADAEAPNHASIVVEFASGHAEILCVGFTDAERDAGFTGIDALRRSGIDVAFGGTSADASVCRIGGEGCGGGECFCECRDAGSDRCRFWGYYTVDSSGRWTFASAGASRRDLRDGDVDGWRYANHVDGSGPPSRPGAPCTKTVAFAGPGWDGGGPSTGLIGAGAAVALFAGGAWLVARRRRAEEDAS